MNALKAVRSNVVASHLRKLLVVQNRLFSSNTDNDDVVDPPDDLYLIPQPKSRENEPIQQRKARLVYQSRKRGMLENDLLLSTFVAKYLEGFTPKQIEAYDRLINGPSNDWDIYYWATNIKPTPEEYNNEIMDLLKMHCKNMNKESRVRQPDL